MFGGLGLTSLGCLRLEDLHGFPCAEKRPYEVDVDDALERLQ